MELPISCRVESYFGFSSRASRAGRSAGLGEMASAYITVNALGGKVKLVNAQQRVQGMLQLTRLHTLLSTYSSEAEALASFGE